jgi:hypothetical protein
LALVMEAVSRSRGTKPSKGLRRGHLAEGKREQIRIS